MQVIRNIFAVFANLTANIKAPHSVINTELGRGSARIEKNFFDLWPPARTCERTPVFCLASGGKCPPGPQDCWVRLQNGLAICQNIV